MDVYRSDVTSGPIASGVSGTSYSDKIGKNASGTYTYWVCLSSDSTVCSSQDSVAF